MTAQELLRAIREKGLEIEATGESIVLRPKSAVTDEIACWMVQHKPAILWIIRRRRPCYPLHEVWVTEQVWREWLSRCRDMLRRQAREETTVYDEVA